MSPPLPFPSVLYELKVPLVTQPSDKSSPSDLFSLRYFFLQKSTFLTTNSTGRKLKWLLKKVSAFTTYDLYLFYVIEWLNNENIPSLTLDG